MIFLIRMFRLVNLLPWPALHSNPGARTFIIKGFCAAGPGLIPRFRLLGTGFLHSPGACLPVPCPGLGSGL